MSLCCAHVHPRDPRMSIRTTHERQRDSPGQMNIIYIATLAQQHTRILDPPHLRADHFTCTNETGCHNCLRRKSESENRGMGESGTPSPFLRLSVSPVHLFGCRHHRLYDISVAGATAKVT